MRLKELRKQKNLTQTDIASVLNIATSTYSGYELKTSEPTIETLCKLADYYRVSLDFLCEHKTNSVSDYGFLSKEQNIAIKILLNLPETKFYEYLGRLKTTADLLKIQY